MTRRYDDGSFIEREPSRRALRDEYRDKFFAELGGERLKDPFDFDPDPGTQLGVVMELIEKAQSLHDDEKSALTMLSGSVATGALGVPAIGATPLGRPSFAGMTLNSMEHTMFDRWFGSAAYGGSSRN